MTAKGILLYSGGLDSLLAAKLLMDQGVELTGLHFILPFYPPDFDINTLSAVKQAEQIGLKLEFYKCGKEYLEMLRNPLHGYGKNINPCIDCKIFFIKKAAEYMIKYNADFVASGEVVGQRPMSQLKHTLKHIEKSTELKGKLLRPLSAKLLEPTFAEIEGKVDREKLLDINGRGRKRQLEIAAGYGITDYSSPSGGCLFTDANIAARIQDIFDNETDINETDIYSATLGRHYRTENKGKIIIARNERESRELEKLKESADCMFYPVFSGPTVFVKGKISKDDEVMITAFMAKYGKPEPGEKRVSMICREGKESTLYAREMDTESYNRFRI
jgi:tRNA U34 2-thiouridine synthase MnmA/TrmU